MPLITDLSAIYPDQSIRSWSSETSQLNTGMVFIEDTMSWGFETIRSEKMHQLTKMDTQMDTRKDVKDIHRHANAMPRDNAQQWDFLAQDENEPPVKRVRTLKSPCRRKHQAKYLKCDKTPRIKPKCVAEEHKTKHHSKSKEQRNSKITKQGQDLDPRPRPLGCSDPPPCKVINVDPSDDFHIRPYEVKPHHGTRHSPKRGQMKIAVYLNCGLLTIHVIQARHLKPVNMDPSMDTYAKLSLIPDYTMRTFCKTEVSRDTNQPQFDEKFSFELMPEDYTKRILLSLWQFDNNTRRSHIIGCMSFGLRKLAETGKVIRGWYFLLAEGVGRTKHLQAQDIHKNEDENVPTEVNKDLIWMERHQVTVKRGCDGFGFSVLGSCPVTISKVKPGSDAERAGICVNDVIGRVNGQNVSRSTCESVARIIKHCQGQVTLDLMRPANVPKPKSSQWAPALDQGHYDIPGQHKGQGHRSTHHYQRLTPVEYDYSHMQHLPVKKQPFLQFTNQDKITNLNVCQKNQEHDKQEKLSESPANFLSPINQMAILPCPLVNMNTTKPESKESFVSSDSSPPGLRMEDLREETRFSDMMEFSHLDYLSN